MGFEVLESQALTGSSSESVARMGQGGEAAGDRVGGQNGFPSVRMWYSVDLGHRGPPETYDLHLELVTSFLEPQVGRMLMGVGGPSSGPSFLGELR